MMPYIINVALILTGCFAFYKIFLQKETFYRVNRMVLVACIGIAFALPLVRIPQEWAIQKKQVVADLQQPKQQSQTELINKYTLPTAPSQQTVEKKADESAATSSLTRQATIAEPGSSISFAQLTKWLFWLYWIGVIIFSLNFLLQVVILFLRAYLKPAIVDGKYRIVEMEGEHAPCSFLNNIFINPSRYDWNTYTQVLLHEKVHVAERHSLDILLAELMLIFQWFNPFAWMYRKEMENNLEFLTDERVLQEGDMEMTSYQMSLLKVSAAHLPLSLTSNYNQSLLKKRIAMMNAKKSNVNTSWKYFFLVPMFAVFACLLNEPITAQTKSPSNSKNTALNKNIQNKNSNVSKSNTRNASNRKDADTIIDVVVNTRTGKTDTVVKVVPRETIKYDVIQGEDTKNKDNNKNRDHGSHLRTEGYWFATIKGDRIQFQFTDSETKDDNSFSGTGFPLSDFPNLPRGTNGDFKLTREAGTMNFNGKFEGNQGMGKYKFVPDQSYVDFMNQEGIGKLDDEDQIVFFMIDIKKSYVQMLNSEGYTKLDKDNLIAFAAMHIDKEFISGLRANGFANLDADDLVSAKAMNVDGAYIKEIRDAGYKNVTMEQLVSFKAMGIDKAYLAKVSKMKHGEGELDADDVVSLKAMDIDDNYAEQFRQVGYTSFSHEDLISMKAVGVTPEYIKGFKSMGYDKTSIDDFISMKSMSITPEYLKAFQAIGYNQIDADDLVSLKSLSVTPDFIKGFNAIGFKNIPLDEIISVKAVGVTPAYVKDMKAKGFNYTKLEKYVSLKSLADSD